MNNHLKKYINSYSDFPEPGVLFHDVSPLLADPQGLQTLSKSLRDNFSEFDFDVVCGIDARGLIFASMLANSFQKGFVMVRKKGKLPGKTIALDYQLEYGSNHLEIQYDTVKAGQKVLIIDDVLATGGTARAAAELVEMLQGKVIAMGFVIELKQLKGRELLQHYQVKSLLQY